jgi:soluble lytic murein transglycosylase-like protein
MYFLRFILFLLVGLETGALPIPKMPSVSATAPSCFESDALILRGIFQKSDARPPIIQFLSLAGRHPNWWKWFPETMLAVQKRAEQTTNISAKLSSSDQKKVLGFFHKHPPRTAAGWLIYLKIAKCPAPIWKKTFYAFLPTASLEEFKDIYPQVLKWGPTIHWSVENLPLVPWIMDGTQKCISDCRSLLAILLPGSKRLTLLSRLLARAPDATIWNDYAAYTQKNPKDIILSRAMVLCCLRNGTADQTHAARFCTTVQQAASQHPSDWINLDIRIMRQFIQDGHEAASTGHTAKARGLYKKGLSIPITALCEKAHDAHWTKGFIYFVGLQDYSKALNHFAQSSRTLSRHLLDPKKILTSGPAITRAARNGLIRHDVRALFWCGLCCDYLKKPKIAQAYYTLAAQYGTFLYGKWASWKLNQPIVLNFARSDHNPKKDWTTSGQRETLRIMHAWQPTLLKGKPFPAYQTTLSLCKDIMKLAVTPGDHARALQLIAALYPMHVVESAKLMAKKSNLVFRSLYPILQGVKEKNRALVHSIILAESCFKPSALSWDGGRGIMQIMLETAKTAAKEMGIPLDIHRLGKDQLYQIQMGAHILNNYFKKMNDHFPPGIASYNAGVVRATEWVQKTPTFSMPEDGLIWAESIPFQITRHYVLTVMESHATYRQLMGNPLGRADWVKSWQSHRVKIQ